MPRPKTIGIYEMTDDQRKAYHRQKMRDYNSRGVVGYYTDEEVSAIRAEIWTEVILEIARDAGIIDPPIKDIPIKDLLTLLITRMGVANGTR